MPPAVPARVRGGSVPFGALVHAFEQIEPITGRLRITDILSDLFRRIIAWSPDDLRFAVYLCTNRVRHGHARRWLGGRTSADQRRI